MKLHKNERGKNRQSMEAQYESVKSSDAHVCLSQYNAGLHWSSQFPDSTPTTEIPKNWIWTSASTQSTTEHKKLLLTIKTRIQGLWTASPPQKPNQHLVQLFKSCWRFLFVSVLGVGWSVVTLYPSGHRSDAVQETHDIHHHDAWHPGRTCSHIALHPCWPPGLHCHPPRRRHSQL